MLTRSTRTPTLTRMIALCCTFTLVGAAARASELVWESLSGMYGGGVDEVVAMPGGGVLARAGGGVWRSADRGDSWTAAPDVTHGWLQPATPSMGSHRLGCSRRPTVVGRDGPPGWTPLFRHYPRQAMCYTL